MNPPPGAEPGSSSTPDPGRRWRRVPGAHHARRPPARLPVILIAVGLLLAGVAVDRGSGPVRVVAGPAIVPMPAAAPVSALSSSWFCAGPMDQPAGVAAGTLVIANATGLPRHATVTLIGDHGPAATITAPVGPYGRVSVPEAQPSALAFTGAEVDVDGGGVAVEQAVSGTSGPTVSPCATEGSDHWYFADGTTQEKATLVLSLLNPYTDDAIVDLSFVTELGREAPDEFQGVVVPARTLVAVDVGSHLRRRARVATTVATRTGRVVAWRTQVVGPTPGGSAGSAAPGGSAAGGTVPGTAGSAAAGGTGTAALGGVDRPRAPGLSVALGASSAGIAWSWPDGVVSDGVSERFRIYNPGPTEADVSLTVLLEQGSAEPFRLKIAGHDTATVDAGAEPRIPRDGAHAAVLRSTNGAGVVAERTVDAAPPSPFSGQLDLAGARISARRWLLAAGSAGPALDERVVIFNPGPAATDVSVAELDGTAPADLPGLSGLLVPAGRRLAVRIGDHTPTLDRALLVMATGRVVVERDLYPSAGPGWAAALGVPLDSRGPPLAPAAP